MLDEKRIAGTHLAPYLRNVDVQWEHVNTTDLPEMDFSAEDRERLALREGDLLVCEGGEVGRTAIWDGRLSECYFQKAIHRLRPITNSDEPRFFRYFMQMAAHRGLFALFTASTIQHLPAEKLRVVRYPSPPLWQQGAIADLLDRETARTDALVAEKERVLGLLAEKRRALITRAVTRGLDPRVPLRDSGIPWLGEIPAHWKVMRLKFVVNRIEQGWSPECYSTPASRDEWGVLKAGCCNGGVFSREENKALPLHLDAPTELEVKPGDVLMSRASGSTDLIGSVALVPSGTRTRLLLSDKTYRLWMTPGQMTAPFLVAALGSHIGRTQVQRVISGAEGLANNIAQSDIKEFVLPLPSESEQRAIVAYIASETAKIDAMRAATERTISLIKERRAALIAAAVTGQIDVSAGV
jgi:type I restriction enzyme S subunit